VNVVSFYFFNTFRGDEILNALRFLPPLPALKWWFEKALPGVGSRPLLLN